MSSKQCLESTQASKRLSIYSFGSNSKCQLSQPGGSDLYIPTLVPAAVRFSSKPADKVIIRSNGNHTLLLYGGYVYCTGDNTYGQCFQPTDIDLLETFKEVPLSIWTTIESSPCFISAGWEFSMIVVDQKSSSGIDAEQKILVAGYGPKGELGLGKGRLLAKSPETIPEFPPTGRRIIDVASGIAHTVFLLDDGTLWGVGHSRKGQLGKIPGVQKCSWNVVQIEIENYLPAKISCGRDFTAMIDRHGKIQILLDVTMDNFGIIDSIKSASLDKTRLWKDFQTGWTSIHVLLDSGKIISWGSNSHGQFMPTGVPKVLQMACGSEHTIALCVDRKIYAWGWGEHGNCGNTVNKSLGLVDICTATVVHELPLVSSTSDLGAGCATSWIVERTNLNF
ncbi:regulator of chromosome condensation 1/beta-lactamase-inhibitor protein II [Dipodascopsis uninucleata]